MRGSQRGARGRVSLVFAMTAIVVLIVLLGSGTALASPPWSDAPNSWWMATYQVTDQQIATIADGYPDNTFRPLLKVTRGQFAKMVVDGMDVPTATPYVYTFRDVPASNYFFPWIEGGAAAHILSGFPDGTYGPFKTIIRQQANSILGSYLAQKELNIRGHIAGSLGNYPSLNTWYLAEGMAIIAGFADGNRVATVHAPATAYLIMRGVVQGTYSFGWMYLGPDNDLTRAQAATLVLRVQGIVFSTAVPTITSLEPASGPAAGGNTVVITGTHFVDVTSVAFGATQVAFTVNSSTQITVTAPSGTLGSTVEVTVTTAAGSNSTSGTANDYTYGIPTLTTISPAAGAAAGGTTVVITGTNLSGATAVKFGTKLATSFTVNSNTQITAKSPAGTAGTTVDVTVTTPGGTTATSQASKFSYGAPTVTSLSPASGPAVGGTSVTITGTGFTGVTSVKFGTKNATSYTVSSPTQIVAVAPSGDAGTSVDVTVSTSAGTSATGTATKYSYGGPVITSISPTSGPTTGGTTVIITGTGFTGVVSVKFGAKNALSFTVNSTTQITAVAPSGSSGDVVDVTVTTSSGTSLTGAQTKYTYGPPVVTSVDPSAGPEAGGNTVTITGSGFVGVTAVKFGTQHAIWFNVISSTQILAKVPAGTNGVTVNVTVTTPAGTSPTSGPDDDYTYGAAGFIVRMTSGALLSATNKTAGVPFTVRVTAVDSEGETITGFTGTVVLTSNSWIGPVNVNITSNGYANVSITPTIAGTLRHITATWGSVVTTNASGNFTVVPSNATKLQVLVPGETAAPGTVSGKTGDADSQGSGDPFTVRVNAVDDYWNVVTAATGTVTIGSACTTDNLPQSHALSGGSWTFTNVILSTAGDWTIVATHATLIDGTSSEVTVTGAFNRLLIIAPGESPTWGVAPGKTGTPSARTAGTAFTVTVYACDANWNQVTSVTDTVSITSTDVNAVLPANAALVGGQRTFNVTLCTAPGPWNITATDVTDGTKTANSSTGIAVNPGALNGFQFGVIADQVAGVDFSVTITAYDACDNVKTNFDGTATLADLTATASPTSVTFASGVWTGDVTITKARVNDELVVTSGAISDDSNPFDVVAGNLAKIVFRHRVSTSDAWTQTDLSDGGAGGRYWQIRLLDGYNNPLANLGPAALLALDIELYTSDDGGAWAQEDLENLATYPGGSDSNGYVTFTNFFVSGGAGYNDAYFWSDTGTDNDVPDVLTEVISTTRHIVFE